MDDFSDLTTQDLDVVEEMQASSGTPEEVLEKHCRCGLCGSHLHFTHVTDFSRNLTQETAKCPECGYRVRKVLHKLQ